MFYNIHLYTFLHIQKYNLILICYIQCGIKFVKVEVNTEYFFCIW